MEKNHSRERRRFTRYEVKDNVFVAFRPYFDRLGKIKNISMGGIAFEYPTYENYSPVEAVEVDIFSQAKDFHLPRIPCRVVYDTVAQGYPSFNLIETRRCGLEFNQLNEQQMSQLQTFLNDFA